MRYYYEVFGEPMFSEYIGYYYSYGILCKGLCEKGRPYILNKVRDVCLRREIAEDISEKCTAGQLHPDQLMDVIEDMLL